MAVYQVHGGAVNTLVVGEGMAVTASDDRCGGRGIVYAARCCVYWIRTVPLVQAASCCNALWFQ